MNLPSRNLRAPAAVPAATPIVIQSFPPIAAPDAQVLVLGSMPGAMSLRLQQYYGHPQNAFWKVMGALLGFDAAGSYEQRTAAMRASHVAVWDVLAACVREGSLDSAIERDSIVPNDFAGFFAQHPCIRRVCFNGATAANVYQRHVMPHVPLAQALDHVRLPSTSPAHAGMPLAAKLAAWRAGVLAKRPA